MSTRRPTPARRRRGALLAAALAVLMAPVAALPPAAAVGVGGLAAVAEVGSADPPDAGSAGTDPTGRQWIDRPERVELPEGGRNATFEAFHCRVPGQGDRVALMRYVDGRWLDIASRFLDSSQMCETVTWTLREVERGLGGSFAMVTRQGSTTLDSVTFMLVVRLNPPRISHPAGGTVRLGQRLTLTSTGSYGTEWPFPTAEWESSRDGHSWTPTGETGSVYRTPPATPEMDGMRYRAVHRRINMDERWESGGVAVSDPATLTVRQEPTITADPSAVEVPVGGTAVFEAAAVGAPVPTVRWESAPPGGAFAPIPGATRGRLEVPDVRAEMEGTRYRAVFSSTQGVRTTREAVLTVLLPPEILEHPRDVAALRGQPVTFTAVAERGDSWQWQRQPPGSTGEDGWTDLAGARSPTYSVVAGPLADGDRYRVVVTGPGGTTASDPATLTLLQIPPVRVSVEPRARAVPALPGW